jgi:two-component sensor histidine kinase/CheY-like chemotaxis protein
MEKKRSLRVLLVEDSEDDAELMLRELQRGPWEVRSHHVDGTRAMTEALAASAWDVVISDYYLPGFGGLEALALLRQKRPGTPFILVSGAIGEEAAVAALKAGANDYLMKDRLARLIPAVQRSLEEAEARRARLQAEDDLRASLTEKETLLKEIHHRVKNNLQVVYSLINLQTRHVRDPKTLEGLCDCRDRVKAMAMVHEMLYGSKDLGRIDFGQYIQELTRGLTQSYAAEGVGVSVDAEGVRLGIDEAVPCGLLVYELVSNSLKHAFPGGRRGKVSVSFTRDAAGGVRLVVQDDGVGFARPSGTGSDENASLGLKLVRTLTEQLNGRMEEPSDGPGTRVGISFPPHFAQTPKEALSGGL